jgi:NADH-quinone oxidoreductase subunit N
MSYTASFSSQLRSATSANSTSTFSTFSQYLPSPVVLLLPVFLFLGEAALAPIFTAGPSLSGWSFFYILPVGITVTSLLLFALFLPAGGEFTRFIHRLGGAYLLFHLFLSLFSVGGFSLRYDTSFFERLSPSGHLRSELLPEFDRALLIARQADPLFPRLFAFLGTAFLLLFLFGAADRFLFSRRTEREFPLLLLLLHIGGLFAVRLSTLPDILLSLERITLASYVLFAFDRSNRYATYAGVQAFLLGSVPSARLLLSFSLLYLHGGALSLPDLDLLLGGFSPAASLAAVSSLSALSSASSESTLPFILSPFAESLSFSVSGNLVPVEDLLPSLLETLSPLAPLPVRALLLLFFNLLFKRTAAPFHFWAPSVYGKASLPSVTFLSIYTKGRRLLLLFKLLSTVFGAFSSITTPFLLFIGVLSVLIGRIGAFPAVERKPFLVYSSRGHVGFRLVGLALSTLDGAVASVHYVVIYALTSLLSWFLLLTLGRRAHRVSSLASLRLNDPILALLLALLFLSRSGLPPLGGFFVKLDVFASLLASDHLFVAYALFLRTVASFFYYLRIVKVLFFDSSSLVDLDGNNSAGSLQALPAFEYPFGRVFIRRAVLTLLVFYLTLLDHSLFVVLTEVLVALFLF